VVSFDYGNGYLSESGLDLKDLKKFKKVISGHYHKYQVKNNLTYIGTPFSHSFGESNQDKFIGIFDMDTYEMELIRTPFASHITVNINCDDPNPSMEGYCDDDYVRVIFSGTQDNIAKARAKYTFPDDAKIIERPNDEFMNNVSIDETADNFVKFKEWAKEIRGLDPETTQLGVDILEAVK
jgi:DNA repair exonuclease SbcCD nuclease subunit